MEKLLIIEGDPTIPVQVCELIIEIVNKFSKQAEPHFRLVCPNLVMNLGDSRVSISGEKYNFCCRGQQGRECGCQSSKKLINNIVYLRQHGPRKNSMNALTTFFKVTKNFDLVFQNIIKYGYNNGNVSRTSRVLLGEKEY